MKYEPTHVIMHRERAIFVVKEGENLRQRHEREQPWTDWTQPDGALLLHGQPVQATIEAMR